MSAAALLSADASSGEPAFLTIEEAASVLRVNHKTLREAIRKGKVPGVIRMGRAIRIARASLLGWAPASACPALGEKT